VSRDFEDILRQWDSLETRKAGASGKKAPEPRENPMARMLEQYPPGDSDRNYREPDRRSPGLSEKQLRQLAPQARLDLHGRTVEESLAEVRRFLDESLRKGLVKILIIHGKGYHSPGQKPVLKKQIRQFLESSPAVGRFGSAERNQGGEGATWVILRKKKGQPTVPGR